MEIICKTLNIQPQRLRKPNPIQRFDGKVTKPITNTIYTTSFVENHSESPALLHSTNLGQHFITPDCPWMKKYRVLLDMINDSITFSLRYYTYLITSLFPVKKNENNS